MNEAIIIAVLGSGLFSAIASIIVAVITNSKTKALFEFKIDALTQQVNKHNNIVERTYKLEEFAVLYEEKVKVANHRIDDLESKFNAKK